MWHSTICWFPNFKLQKCISIIIIIFYRALFDYADTDGNGSVSFDELQNIFETYPDIIDNLTIRYALSPSCIIIINFLVLLIGWSLKSFIAVQPSLNVFGLTGCHGNTWGTTGRTSSSCCYFSRLMLYCLWRQRLDTESQVSKERERGKEDGR